MSALLEHADQIMLSPAEVLAALADLERRTALAALAIRRLEATAAHEPLGAATMKEWLRTHARMTDERAGEFVARGRFLDAYSDFAEAAVTGVLSISQIDLARKLHRPKYASTLAASQRELVGHLASVDIAGGIAVIDRWKTNADAVLDETAPAADKPRELSFGRTLDDRLHGTIGLDDAAATEFEKAILNAITWNGAEESRTLAQRQGDALFDIVTHFNKHHDGNGTPRHLPTISLSADITTVLSDEPEAVNNDTRRPMSPACTGMYLCDCKIHVILRKADGTPEKFGRDTYTVPRNLFQQVADRDGGCRFPGCDRTVRFTDAHHIHHWEHGGSTDYENLLLLCRRHHVHIHKQQVKIKLDNDGTTHFIWNHGIQRDSTPRGAPPKRPPDPHPA